ncbi:MAG: 4Fe-4S binding protein [Desulfobacterales bacterium]|nr:4Fe-4S binding protein [Desulfobacterales bacterium]
MLLSKFRQFIQVCSAILVNCYVDVVTTKTINTGIQKGICVPFLNCYACPSAVFSCPIGTLQHFFAIRVFPFYTISLIFIVGLLTGRMSCGWLCPFGFLQDLLYRIPSRKWKLPYFFRYAKYGILVLFVIALPYYTGDSWFSKVCPAGTLTAGIPWVLWNPVSASGQPILPDGPGVLFYFSLCLLILFLIGFVFSQRPFCKAICPLGALLSFFNGVSLIHIRVPKKCEGCTLCRDLCPMDLNVLLEVNSGECIRCLECTRCGHIQVESSFYSKIKRLH